MRLAFLVGLAAFAHPGIGIVADSRGNVYYTDLKHVWSGGQIVVRDVHSHELYMDANDVLYGEHLWIEAGEARHRVWRRLPSGVVEDVIPARKGYRADFHFVRDAKGVSYPPRRGAGWIAVNSLGSAVYYVSGGDLYRNAEVVARGLSEDTAVPWHVRAVGWVLRVTRIHVGPDHDVGRLWLDGEGNVYLAVPGARTVKRITPRGDVSVVLRGAGEWTVVSGAFLRGEHWVLETGAEGRARARRLTAEDVGTVSAQSGWWWWVAGPGIVAVAFYMRRAYNACVKHIA